MDRETKEKIFDDYEKAQRNIQKVLLGGPNFWVKSIKQYLSPTVVCSECDLKDERGELNYYTKIRDTLEKALLFEEAPFSWHFNGAEDYIKKYLINKP